MKKALILFCVGVTTLNFGRPVTVVYARNNQLTLNDVGDTITASCSVDDCWRRDYGRSRRYMLRVEKNIDSGKFFAVANSRSNVSTRWDEIDSENPVVGWAWEDQENPELTKITRELIRLIKSKESELSKNYISWQEDVSI